MDNVCHTLVGAACARAGFARPVRFAAVTSMIAANLPDLDVLVFATDVPSVAFRRGWTHGIVAQALLPAALAGLMFALARQRDRTESGGGPAALAPLMLLSYVGVLSHVFLDYLNNYGVRLLMPFSGRWFYGDSLFIVDPWLWIAFGAATVLGRRARPWRTRVMLVVASVYVLVMIGSARAARRIVLDDWQRTYGSPPRAVMVGPVPVNPFRKALIVDAGDHYRTGAFSWSTRTAVYSAQVVAKNDTHPAVRAARHNPRVAGILVWSRFPFWDIVPAEDGTQVTVRDVRFAGFGRGGFTATTVVR